MKNFLVIAEEFYKNYKTKLQPEFSEHQKLKKKVSIIIENSSFLEKKQKQKIKTVVKFLGKKAIEKTINTLMRQNIRNLITKIESNEKFAPQ